VVNFDEVPPKLAADDRLLLYGQYARRRG
jgi:hypothetical protein